MRFALGRVIPACLFLALPILAFDAHAAGFGGVGPHGRAGPGFSHARAHRGFAHVGRNHAWTAWRGNRFAARSGWRWGHHGRGFARHPGWGVWGGVLGDDTSGSPVNILNSNEVDVAPVPAIPSLADLPATTGIAPPPPARPVIYVIATRHRHGLLRKGADRHPGAKILSVHGERVARAEPDPVEPFGPRIIRVTVPRGR